MTKIALIKIRSIFYIHYFSWKIKIRLMTRYCLKTKANGKPVCHQHGRHGVLSIYKCSQSFIQLHKETKLKLIESLDVSFRAIVQVKNDKQNELCQLHAFSVTVVFILGLLRPEF